MADTNFTNSHEPENKALVRSGLRGWRKPGVETVTINKGFYWPRKNAKIAKPIRLGWDAMDVPRNRFCRETFLGDDGENSGTGHWPSYKEPEQPINNHRIN